MTPYVGIELSPDACRIVELEGPAKHRGQTRVRAFAVLPREGPATNAAFRALAGRPVTVVAWGIGADHRQVVVDRSSRERMTAEAVVALQAASVSLDHVLADVTPAASGHRGPADRHAVQLVAAPVDRVLRALGPLVAAGVRPRSLVTSGLALASLSRARRLVTPDAAEVYVALEARATCLALVRGGALFAAREIAWGFENRRLPRGEPARRDAIAARLAEELRMFLAVTSAGPIAQVCVCGALPDLRTMAMSLTERLDLEVEPLDSLLAIDPGGSAFARLGAGRAADEFRQRSAELRLAWAAAADSPAPLNLLWSHHRRASRLRLARVAAAVALAAAGGVAAWMMQRHARSVAGPPPLIPLTSVSETRVQLEPRPSRLASERTSATSGQFSAADRAVSSGTGGTSTVTPASPVPGAAAPVQSTPSLDARLETILYAPDRAFALVDGQVVQVGDIVRGAKIVEITPSRVLLRDPQGRVRRLLFAPSR